MSVKIRCLKCGDIIESKHRHDFKECSCGACFIDGGGDPYVRIGGDPEFIQEIKDEDDF